MIFSEDKIQDYQDAYGAFNKEEKGVPVTELKHILRALGYFPTQEEVRKIEESLSGKTEVNFEEFIEVLKRADKKSTPSDDLLNTAFYEFDLDGEGIMTPAQLRYVLTTMGESWTEQEVDEFFQILRVEKDKFDYREIIKLMSAAQPFQS